MSRTVTLLTGDRVVVRGEHLSVQPAKGREKVGYATLTAHGHDYVIPADARRLVAAGTVDRRLFDITTLLEFGYDDSRRATIPLIITHPEGAAAPRVAAGTGTRDLPSVNGRAVSVAKSTAMWEALTDDSAGRMTTARGVSKIWLDGKRRSTLDVSVPQIGAPAAWDAGHTGAGVTVAVLDSGVDQTHPDLTGQEIAEANFSEAPDNVDRAGHGTHVASTIVGTGTQSDGKYRGVAPDASIVDGKVLDDQGYGFDSGVIAGMQWAVEQEADIVNLSLGARDTPEIDPVEQAVNTLSAEHGTLFVVAAGNSGPSPGSINSPGSADAALTVGAVDDNDQIAEFSSRGPRAGDGGIKPDITAPGVGIAAAKAANGFLGDPVEDGYVALSGTSMATPHVAGAAALLASAHPDWTGAELKAALTGSATSTAGATAFDQGTGRVEVAAALDNQILAEPANLAFGTALWPHSDDEPITRTLTYRNTGDTASTVRLAVDAHRPDGGESDIFSLSATEVVIPAGETTTVEVIADTRRGGVDGLHTGMVVATAGESTIRTPVVVEREVESYTVTYDYLNRAGAPATNADTLFIGLDNLEFRRGVAADGRSTARLPKGTYAVEHRILGENGDFSQQDWMIQPGLVLDRDVTLTVDARTAEPVDVTPPAPAENIGTSLGYALDGPGNGFGSAVAASSTTGIRMAQVGDVPAGYTVDGTVDTEWLDEAGGYYHLAWYPRGLPVGFTKVVTRDELATVRVDVGKRVDAGGPVHLVSFANPTTNAIPAGGANGITVTAPTVETLYLTTVDTEWDFAAWLDNPDGSPASRYSAPATKPYAAGRTYRESFNYAVFGPTLPTEPSGYFPTLGRVQDQLSINVPMYGDRAGNLGDAIPESAWTRLYAGDELIGELPYGGYGRFSDLPAESVNYRVSTESVRGSAFMLSPSVSAEWTFHSSYVDGTEPATLPINVLRFLPSLDADNRAPAGTRFLLPITMQNHTGGYVTPRGLTVEASYDEGRTWQRAPVLINRVAVLTHPTDAETVSLRASASDKDGNTVKHTIISAYHLN